MLDNLFKSLMPVVIEVLLENLDELEEYLMEKAKETENTLDDTLVKVFMDGLQGILTGLKE